MQRLTPNARKSRKLDQITPVGVVRQAVMNDTARALGNQAQINRSTINQPNVQTSADSSETASTTGKNDARPLEFVTFTSSPGTSHPTKNADALRIIRSQAMKDYVWKENHPSITTEASTQANRNLGRQSNYMRRFRLNAKSATVSQALSSRLQHQILDGSQVQLGKRFNPFDITLLNLGPRSERLIFYYHQAYSMNMVALDFKDDCLSNAIADPTLLHAVLYIVATDYDPKRGEHESALSKYHGGEAVRLINKHLHDGVLTDTMVAAIAIMATRENLNGGFQLASMHMNGLQLVIAKRGGIQNIKGIFRRVATWSDFCDANVRNCHPRFCLPPSAPRRCVKSFSIVPKMLELEGIFGSTSIVPIFQALRCVSMSMDPNYSSNLDKTSISLSIYNIEYDLNLLNGTLSESSTNKFPEAVSLKIASHIYLYQMIRDLPSGSLVLDKLARRLCTVLKTQEERWWGLRTDRQRWFLWMLFMGYGAALEGPNKLWFLQKTSSVCEILGLTKNNDFLSVLTSVIWRGSRCEDQMKEIWREVSRRKGFDTVELQSMSHKEW